MDGLQNYAFRIQQKSPRGWEDIAGENMLHRAQIMRDSFAPRPDSQLFKDLQFRIVDKEGREQK